MQVRRVGWNQQNQDKKTGGEFDEILGSPGNKVKTYEEIEKEKEIRRMFDLVVRSKKLTLKEELTREPLDPYPSKHFRALKRRASYPFARDEEVLREAQGGASS